MKTDDAPRARTEEGESFQGLTANNVTIHDVK